MDLKNKAEVENNPNEAASGRNWIVFELDFENSLLKISLSAQISC